MNYRESEILTPETIATAGTKVIDINIADPISRLVIEMRLTNATTTPVGHPALAAKTIELVDGSDVIFSMSGKAARALDFYNLGVQPWQYITYINGNMSTMLFNLNFGRYLYDPELALDPKRFTNLQLRVVHDKALGGNTPTAGTLGVWADIFDQKVPSLRGYLCSKEHYSVADLSNDINYVDLPTDYTLRRMLVMSDCDDKSPSSQYNKLKLTEEHDKRVLFDQSTYRLLKRVCQAYPAWIEDVTTGDISTAIDHFVTTHYENAVVGSSVTANTATAEPLPSAGGLQSLQASAAGNMLFLFRGWVVHGAIPLNFGLQQDLNDWWDVTRLGSARLKITQSSSVSGSDTIEVITEQLRSY